MTNRLRTEIQEEELEEQELDCGRKACKGNSR
jgi:hypothetical protein